MNNNSSNNNNKQQEEPVEESSQSADKRKDHKDHSSKKLFKDYRSILSRSNIWINSLSLFILINFVSTWFFLLPLYLRRMGADDGQIGIAYVFFVLSFSILQVPGGYIADKIGRKKIIAYPTILLPIVYIFSAYSQNWVIVMALLSVGNLIQGIQIPALFSLIAESVDENDAPLGYSLMEISLAVGFTTGPLIGYAVLNNPFMSALTLRIFGETGDIIQLMMLMTSIATIPCFIIRLFLKDMASHEDFQINGSDVLKKIDSNLIWLLIAFVFFGLMVNTTFYGPFIPMYAQDVLGLNEKSIQVMFAAGGGFAVIFNIFLGGIVRRLGSRKSMIFGMLGHMFFFVPWLIVQSVPPAVVLYILTYILLQLSYIGSDTMMNDLTDIKTRSTIIGLLFMVPGILGAAAPWLGSLAVEYSSHFLPSPYPMAIPFILALLFSIAGSLSLLPIKSDRI